MAEDLDGLRRRSRAGGDLLQRELAGEHNLLRVEHLVNQAHALGPGDSHLRADVQLQLPAPLAASTADELRQPDVLHDDGIDARAVELVEVLLRLLPLIGKDEDVHRDAGPHAVAMQVGDEGGKVVAREVVRPHAGVEAIEAEVDRMSTVGHGGPHAVPVAGGGENFRGVKRHGERPGVALAPAGIEPTSAL